MAFRGKKKDKKNNNRPNLILAVIFLLFFLIYIRLIYLQIFKHDVYRAMASDQHEVYSKLEPVRGKIFIQDSASGNNEKLYPVATNKDFALVYAVPSIIENPRETAEKLYEILDKSKVENEVEVLLGNDEYFKNKEEGDLNPLGQDDESIAEFKQIKKEAEVEIRKKNIIENYFVKLSKSDDPYEPIKQKVDDAQLNEIKNLNINGIQYKMESFRYYPENNVGSHLIGFVGYSSEKKVGQYGLEGFLNDELTGKYGSIKAERAASGELIIINDREYTQPTNGSDLILTINRSVQYVACEKLKEAGLRHGADKGTVIAMDPKTGAIIAMCSWPDYNPNNYGDTIDRNIYNNISIFDQYEPGSVFKVITMAAGIDDGKVSPNTTYTDKGFLMIEGWPKPIKNSDYESFGGHGTVNMVSVLENSLNTGAIFVEQKVGNKKFTDYVQKFGFGEKTGIELETENKGNITNLIRKSGPRPVEAATASFGQGITVTPLQMVSSFAAIANGGMLMKPYIVEEIRSADGNVQKTQPTQVRRVISEKASYLLSAMMVKVVENGHAKRAKVDGYYVAGKTGTAQVADKEKGGYREDATIHTFIGFTPIEDPKFVMLVRLDHPRDAKFAESTSVPLFKEIAEFILNYYQVPKEK